MTGSGAELRLKDSMFEQHLKEVFEVIRNANTNNTVYTTHDNDIAEAERAHILQVLKAKWPQEAAMLDTTVPKFTFRNGSSSL